MLNRKSIERSLAKYVTYKDSEVLARLTAFGPMILKAADLSKQMAVPVPAVSEEDYEAARESKLHLLNKYPCLLYTSPSPRDRSLSRMPSSA